MRHHPPLCRCPEAIAARAALTRVLAIASAKEAQLDAARREVAALEARLQRSMPTWEAS